MTITALSIIRRDPALLNSSGLIAGATGPAGAAGAAGAAGPRGLPGVAGPAGSAGSAGRGISSVEVDANNHLIVTYTDGSTADAGPVTVAVAGGADGGTF